MYYTYKNCTFKLNGQEYIAQRAGFTISSSADQPIYRADKKYANYYQASNAVVGSLDFSYFLTGTDSLHDNIYKEGVTISGDFGGMVFPSGYLTNYSIDASPLTAAIANVQVTFFDELTGEFKPQVSKPEEQAILNFYDAKMNGSGFGAMGYVTNASFRYDLKVTPVYKYETGAQGYTNIKPDYVIYGEKKLTTEITVDNLSGDLDITGKRTILSIALKHRDSGDNDLSVEFAARGYIKNKSIQADNETFSRSILSVEQDAPSFVSHITGNGPTGAAVGEIVYISGYNFLSYPDVWIGDHEVRSPVVVNDNLITFIMPYPGPEGKIVLKNGADKSISFHTCSGSAGGITITKIIT